MSVTGAVRSITTGLLWILTTVLLTAAIPAAWGQQHVVSGSGYAALAQRAAADPALQSAMATELTTQVGRLGSNVDGSLVSGIARAYTASSPFPGQFGRANAFAHRWLFTDSIPAGVDEQGRWVIDVAPMLSDPAFSQTLRGYNISLPSSVPIPLTDNAPPALRPGSLSVYGRWAPWVSGGLAILTVAAALLMVLSARRRGRALAALGVSALIAGAAGWAAIAEVQPWIGRALDNASGPVRTVADVMVATAQDSLHQWLTVSLLAGAGLVIVGVIASVLGGAVAARR